MPKYTAKKAVEILVHTLAHGTDAQKLAAAQAILKHSPNAAVDAAFLRILRERDKQ